jgi:hypothetical protein
MFVQQQHLLHYATLVFGGNVLSPSHVDFHISVLHSA